MRCPARTGRLRVLVPTSPTYQLCDFGQGTHLPKACQCCFMICRLEMISDICRGSCVAFNGIGCVKYPPPNQVCVARSRCCEKYKGSSGKIIIEN